MYYLTVKEMGKKWGISSWMVIFCCMDGRIEDDRKIGNMRVVPKDAPKTVDGRRKKRSSNKSDLHL